MIFGIRILINPADGVLSVSVGLHGWRFQLEELLLSHKFVLMRTSNAHCSKDSSAKISQGSSHHAQVPSASSRDHESHKSLNLRWAGMALQLIETLRTNNHAHPCLLMSHRHKGEMVCPELGLNPSRHQSPGLILH